MPSQASEYYASRLTGLEEQLEGTIHRNKIISFFRLFIFLGGLVVIGFSTSLGWPAVIISIVLFLAVFLFLVKSHLSSLSKKQQLEYLIDINKKEVRALAGDYSGFNDGVRFSNPDHPYTSDLDIFGEGSVFQFANRTATGIGRSRLAKWFQNPFEDRTTIINQQEAIEELAGDPGWLQEIQAIGYDAQDEPGSKGGVFDWINQAPEFNHWKYRLYIVVVPLIAAATITLILLKIIPVSFELLYLIIPFGIIGKNFKKITQKHQQLSKKSAVIRQYARLLQNFEQRHFRATRLQQIQTKLKSSGEKPSTSIKQLSRIMNAFDSRLNLLAGFLLNALFLWDILQSVRLERWLGKHKTDIEKWFDAVADYDALISLAVFRFNNPAYCFPAVEDSGFSIVASGAGHPLIPEDQRVDNPINIATFKKFVIITGANMAGKSTYLRTVGVNLILAQMGSPVCAKTFSFTPTPMITSIRTRDNLQKRESYFYAELKNLKAIIDRLEGGEKLFILLDEILKGTNSKDKQSGSFALLRKLIKYDASGLIATHDLALGSLEKDLPDHFNNACFEVALENDQLIFDYLLKKGVAQQMNATYLMEKMGITGGNE